MIQDANGADDLAGDTCLLEAAHVGRVADNQWCAGRLFTASDTASTAIIVEKNFINVGIKHVGTAMDSAKTRERLWQTSETIHGVEERRVTVFAHGFHIELHLFAGINSRSLEVGVLDVKGNSVAQEIDSLGLKTERAVQICHGHVVEVFAVPSVRVIEVNSIHVLVEIAALLLLEETHEI